MVLITFSFFPVISYKNFLKHSKIFLKSFKVNICILPTLLKIPQLTCFHICFIMYLSIYPFFYASINPTVFLMYFKISCKNH